jgi:ribosomal protein S27E
MSLSSLRRSKKSKQIREQPSAKKNAPDESGLPPATDDLCAVNQEGEPVPYKCGHAYASTYAMNCYGIILEPSAEFFQDREHCGDCEVEIFRRFTIRCALCGHFILPGEGVALYLRDSVPRSPQKWQTPFTHSDERISVIGCLRMDCCPTGGAFAGHWTTDGFRPLNDDGLGVAALAMKTGRVVYGSSDEDCVHCAGDESRDLH